MNGVQHTTRAQAITPRQHWQAGASLHVICGFIVAFYFHCHLVYLFKINIRISFYKDLVLPGTFNVSILVVYFILFLRSCLVIAISCIFCSCRF